VWEKYGVKMIVPLVAAEVHVPPVT